MTFNWIDYLTLAEKLQTDEVTEAEMRTIISRAYYCAYHKARVLCVNKLGVSSINFKGASSHKVVIEKLELASDQDLQEIGSKLHALKIRREDADYETIPTKPITPTLASDSIIKAKAIVQLINDYQP